MIPEFIEPINSPYNSSMTGMPAISTKPIQTAQQGFKKDMVDSRKIPGPAIEAGPSSRVDNIQKTHPILSSKPPQPIIDLQIYPEQKKPNPLADKQAMLPLQPFALSSPFIPPQFQNYLTNFMKNFYTPFIYKDYHINLGGPNGDHLKASMIYEDALPPPEIYSSYKTLRERNVLSEYIRGTFIRNDEGESVDWSGGPRSLNSRLKLIQLNPYNTNMFSSNPYYGLPKNLLIYKSCYPIIYEKETSLVQCNKSSVGLNIRVYSLNIKEFIFKYYDSLVRMNNLKLNQDLKNFIERINLELKTIYPTYNTMEFDVWREIVYYAYIRNFINFKNICPNFVSSYCYFLDINANLSYKKNGLHIDSYKDLEIPEILDKEFTNCTMILLTESPNQNLYQWGSNIYIQDKGVRKMVQTGFKPETNWKSVISQMIIIFYVMDKYSFTIREMETNANFYIKDLNVFGDNKQYWLYTIQDIDYYIPNFGHLVMLDHNYKDLTKPENSGKRKIIMRDEFKDDENEIRNVIIDNAINCFNSNNFGSVFIESGGVGLNPNVINLLNEINKFIQDNRSDTNLWTNVIRKFLKDYIHNRVGTPLRDLEINYIRKNDNMTKPFKTGELVVWEEKFDEYKFLLVLKDNEPDKNHCKCISRDKTTKDYIEISAPKDLLYHYTDLEVIQQDGLDGNPIIGYDYIIEKYIL